MSLYEQLKEIDALHVLAFNDPRENLVAGNPDGDEISDALEERFGWNAAEANIMPVFLNLKNPIRHDFDGDPYREISYAELLDQGKREGRDGAIFENTTDGPDLGDIFVSFSPTQIKSALGNTGAFSLENPDIRYARAESAAPDTTADELLARVQAGEVSELTPDEWARIQQAFLGQAAEAVPATGVDAPTFKNWFGNSRIRTKAGAPVTMYHATNAEFTVFDADKTGGNTQHPTAALGFFFTNDRNHAAEKYGGKVLSVYLAIERPYLMTDADLRAVESTDDAKAFRKQLEARGYDGIVLPAETRTRYVAAFRPDQIKRIDNPTYTRGEPDMRFALAPPAPDASVPATAQHFALARPRPAPGTPPQLTPDAMTRIETMQRAIQDRFVRFKTLQNWIKQKGIDLTPDADVYGAEERSVKRFAAKAEDFRNQTLRPLVQEAAKARILKQ